MTKEQFLRKFNPTESLEYSLTKSINVSIQRNKLYKKEVSREIKCKIKYFWRQRLNLLFQEFLVHPWDEEFHNHKIETLKIEMNKEFKELVDFRISHSQKSISVYFKHLWCLDLITNPPQCPVDRKILIQTNCPIIHRNWTNVDTIEEHELRIKYIKQKMKSDCYENLSVWELHNFN